MSVVAIDIGTTNIKAGLATWDGRILRTIKRRTPATRPAPGAFTFPAHAVREVCDDLVRELCFAATGEEVDTIVFSVLGTAMVPVTAEGTPIAEALSPLDRRPQPLIAAAQGLGIDPESVRKTTGQPPDLPSFAAHLLWWKEMLGSHVDSVDKWLSLRGFIVEGLAGVAVEDHSWASRTMLYNLERKDWDERITTELSVPRGRLPELASSLSQYPVRPERAEALGLSRDSAIVIGGIDNSCAVVGALQPEEERAINIVGTFEHAAAPADPASAGSISAAVDGLVFSFPIGGRYLVCSRSETGQLLEILADNSNCSPTALIGIAAVKPIYTHPRPPSIQWVRNALDSGTSAEHIARILAGTSALVLRDFVAEWEGAAGRRVDRVVVVGGGGVDDRGVEQKASIVGRPIARLTYPESGLIGAFRLAAMSRLDCDFASACALFANPTIPTPANGNLDLSDTTKEQTE
jgi:sugar (pentulose or hexulose) kinase